MRTEKVSLDDPYLRATAAAVTASADGWCALSRTVFYPGGGGQPCDRGALVDAGKPVAVVEVCEDGAGGIWHRVGDDLPPGTSVDAVIDWPFRHSLMRHHA